MTKGYWRFILEPWKAFALVLAAFSMVIIAPYQELGANVMALSRDHLDTQAAAPVARKPPPRPSPTAIAGPANLEAAIVQITEHINMFQDTCFGSAIFLGNSDKVRTQFLPKDLVIEDATPNAISKLGSRGAGGALADMTDRYGAPMPNVMYLPFKIPIAPGDKKLASNQRQTVWHEGVHQIEAMHGDRDTADFKAHEAYRERNAAYLDAIMIELSNLGAIEQHARAKPESESPTEWRAWKDNDARNEIKAIADRFAALEKGEATKVVFRGKFKPGEQQEWPPDLRELQVWAGIKIRWSDILDQYASGVPDSCKGLADLDIRVPEKSSPTPPATPPITPTVPPPAVKPPAEKPPAAKPPAATPPVAAPTVAAPTAVSPSSGTVTAAGAWVLERVSDETLPAKSSDQGVATHSPGTVAFTGSSVASSHVLTYRDGSTRVHQASSSWTEFPTTLIPGAPQTIIKVTTSFQPDDLPPNIVRTSISEGEDSSRTLFILDVAGRDSQQFGVSEWQRGVPKRLFVVSYDGPGGTASRTYTYVWNAGVPAPTLATRTTNLSVQIAVDKPTIVLGETTLLKATATGGTPPFTFAWTGPVRGTADQLAVTAVKPGTQAFTIRVTDSTGAAATASASVTTEALAVTIRRASPGTVVLGQSFGFQAQLSAAGKPMTGAFVYRWQPHPEVAYAPFEDAGTQTTAVFTRLGRTRVWVEVLRRDGPVLTTMAESDQIEIDVVGPQLSLTANPSPPYPGQDVRINVTMSPAIPDKYVTFWWEIQGNALNAGPVVVGDAYSRAYTYKPKDMAPVTVTAHAKARDGGDDLGAKAIVITARPHTVQVTPPMARGPKPRIWNPQGGGLVEVDSQLAVFQDVSMRADVTPAPINQPLHYQWTMSPEGCTISNPISQEPTFNCSQTGSFAALVTVRDHLGATLGTGTGNMSVSISQASLQNSKAQEAAAQQGQATRATAQRLRNEGAALQQQNKLREAIAKYRESLTYVPDPVMETFIAQVEAAAVKQEQAAQQGQATRATAQPDEQARRAMSDRLRAEGESLRQQGKLREAIAKYRESLTYVSNPAMDPFIAQLEAFALKQEQAAQQNQANFATATRLRREAQTLEQQGKLREAIAKCRESLRYYPDPALETTISQLEAAAAKQEKAAQQQGGWLSRLGGALDAITDQVQAEQEQAARDTAARLRAEGQALQQQGRLREAVSKYRESLKHVPDPALEANIGQVEAEAARRERATAQATPKPATPPQQAPAPAPPKPAPSAPTTTTPSTPAPAPKPAPPPEPQGCSLSGEWAIVREPDPNPDPGCPAGTNIFSLRQTGTSLAGTHQEKGRCGALAWDSSSAASGSMSGRDFRITVYWKGLNGETKERLFVGSVSADCRTLNGSSTFLGETQPVTYRRR